MKHDILSIEDIQLLVNRFYEKARNHELLGPVFDERIGDHWPEHLEKMYRFWQTVLLNEHTYYSSPFPPHAGLPIESKHFTKWLQLFTETADELFCGEKNEEAKWRAGKMAELFSFKLNQLRQQGNKYLYKYN